MTKTRKPRDMQYIRIENNSVRIEIRRKGNEAFRQSLHIDDYGSLDRCLDQARKIRNQKLVELDQHRMVVHAPTVHELYQKKYDLFPCKLKTRKKHDIFYKQAIAKYGDIPIDKVKISDVQESINNYAKVQTRKQTVHLLAVWRQLFKVAFMLGYPVPNYADAVVIPKCKPSVKKDVSITWDDFNDFLDAVQHYHIYDDIGKYRSTMVYYLLLVMAYTGMSPAEVLGLSRKDFHLNEGYISVTKACASSETDTKQIVDTKNSYRHRNIPIPNALYPIINDLLAWTDHKYVFSDYDNQLIEIDWLSNYIHLISKKCGIQFNMYRLRHAFSTDMFNEGVSPAIIRDMMGHASMNMSVQYAYSTPDERKEAINKRHMA